MPPQNGKQPNNLLDESMQRAYNKVSAEMPNIKRVSVTPRESSFLSKFFMPRGATAITNPFTGNINYNPEIVRGLSDDELEQIMAHELTHVGQTQNQPWYRTIADIFKRDEQVPQGIPSASNLNMPYYWRPREMEAFQAEKNRNPNMYSDPMSGARDILIPSQKRKR